MSSPASYPIESVENAARVLLMLRDQRILRVAEVAADLGVARSSAHRMLTTLQAQGLLRQDEATRGYRVGPRLVELGIAVIGATDLKAEARPVLEELSKATGETVHLIVLEGTQIVFVDGVEGSHAIRAALRNGDRAPAHAGAAGKALLAELTLPELRSRYPGARLRGGTSRAITTRRDLEAGLAQVRERGYATNFGESEDGLHAISAAVRDRAGTPRAAITIAGPSERLSAADLERLSVVLLAGTERLAERLG
jgi:IclR family transcriptional regulator, acetate operon repressor